MPHLLCRKRNFEHGDAGVGKGVGKFAGLDGLGGEGGLDEVGVFLGILGEDGLGLEGGDAHGTGHGADAGEVELGMGGGGEAAIDAEEKEAFAVFGLGGGNVEVRDAADLRQALDAVADGVGGAV